MSSRLATSVARAVSDYPAAAKTPTVGHTGGVNLRRALGCLAILVFLTAMASPALAQQAAPASHELSGEAGLKLPDLSTVQFFNGAIDGHKLLLVGILF